MQFQYSFTEFEKFKRHALKNICTELSSVAYVNPQTYCIFWKSNFVYLRRLAVFREAFNITTENMSDAILLRWSDVYLFGYVRRIYWRNDQTEIPVEAEDSGE